MITPPASSARRSRAANPGAQGLRELQKEVVDVVALLDAHLEQRRGNPRREEREHCTGALDDGVGDQRRPVDELSDLRERDPAARSSSSSPSSAPADDPSAWSGTVDADLPAHRVEQHEVGEGAPMSKPIDTDRRVAPRSLAASNVERLEPHQSARSYDHAERDQDVHGADGRGRGSKESAGSPKTWMGRVVVSDTASSSEIGN